MCFDIDVTIVQLLFIFCITLLLFKVFLSKENIMDVETFPKNHNHSTRMHHQCKGQLDSNKGLVQY